MTTVRGSALYCTFVMVMFIYGRALGYQRGGRMETRGERWAEGEDTVLRQAKLARLRDEVCLLLIF